MIDLADFDSRTRDAVKVFWTRRGVATDRKIESGMVDQGERSAVTAGNNMDGFLKLVAGIVRANGLGEAKIHQKRAALTLPGFFRPTKLWDLLVFHRGQLAAVIEFKSQVGPSFGNNFNNRVEEAIGNAYDLWTAYREGAFGEQPRPFVGWLMLVEETEKSTSPILGKSPHFPILPEFKGASYLRRYDLLCQKMIQENLYTVASVITSKRSAVSTGEYSSLSSMTGIKAFVSTLAGHIAGEAARTS